jgi:PAS domain-containing protein
MGETRAWWTGFFRRHGWRLEGRAVRDRTRSDAIEHGSSHGAPARCSPRAKSNTTCSPPVHHQQRTSLQRHAEILESLAEVVFIIDVSGTIQFVSPAVRRILEYTEDSLTDSSVYDIMSPKSAEEMRQLVEQVS